MTESTIVKPELQELVREILLRLGEDPEREGLRRTPSRVEKALTYLTRGYKQDAESVLNGAVFTSDYDEMVIVKEIDFFSLCEHHLLPFFGKCHIAYLPDKRIVGLSKLPRLVDVFSRRLQVQEKLTMEIARAIEDKLKPKGVGVVMEAAHLCVMMRGVEKQNAQMVTSSMRGRFRSDVKTRDEFLELIKIRRA
ncbi:MAG TPA: GTP cyclohydrolase I FolE [Planctomycetota bacterium]|nr:GTP cyclohydrolase I FolE [Planctomycetota bacterium]